MFPWRALKALREHGIMIVLASGRHKIDLDELPVKDIEFDGYLALNGQLLLDSDREMYSGLNIDEEEMKIFAGIFKAGKIPFAFMTENRRYIKDHDYDNVVELAEQFMDRTVNDSGDADREPWEYIRAAVGYAIYDEAMDSGTDSVLSRADKEMYACKKAMKGS